MNELQRQAYLSAFGIENYMPRWQLAAAPAALQCHFVPVACEFTAAVDGANSSVFKALDDPAQENDLSERQASNNLSVATILADVAPKKSAPQVVDAAAILKQFDVKPSPKVQPFTLSIWRPITGLLIIDSRDTSLALPTEMLLKNILLGVFKLSDELAEAEVLRWPMVENRFVSRTEDDARVELQTWLTVEHELRPINQLWLMGENAAGYLLPEASDLLGLQGQYHPLGDSNLSALILPSLNELLLKPLLKSKLMAVHHND